MLHINNPQEKECIEYAERYIKRYKNLYMKPSHQVDVYSNLWDEVLLLQPPYTNKAGRVQYNDWSIFCKRLGISIRFEISSLKVYNSVLCEKARRDIFEFENMPEKHLVLILLDKGYDEIVQYTLLPLIKKDNLPVTILRSVDEYKNYVDNLFRTS